MRISTKSLRNIRQLLICGPSDKAFITGNLQLKRQGIVPSSRDCLRKKLIAILVLNMLNMQVPICHRNESTVAKGLVPWGTPYY